MNETQTKISLTGLEVRIGITIVLCLLVCHISEMLGLTIQALAACTGAVMCVQEGGKASMGACKNRVLGVICGGIVGIAVVLIDNLLGNDVIFYLLVGLGIMANFLLCKLVRLPLVQARVSCMTVLLVVLVLGGEARIHYAIGRFIGTLVGAVIAWGVSALWDVICAKKPA